MKLKLPKNSRWKWANKRYNYKKFTEFPIVSSILTAEIAYDKHKKYVFLPFNGLKLSMLLDVEIKAMKIASIILFEWEIHFIQTKMP